MEKIERNIDTDRRIIADYYRTESQYEKAVEIQTKAFTEWSKADTRDYTHPEQNINCIELYAKYIEARRNTSYFRERYLSLKSQFDEVMKFYEIT